MTEWVQKLLRRNEGKIEGMQMLIIAPVIIILAPLIWVIATTIRGRRAIGKVQEKREAKRRARRQAVEKD